MLTMTLCACVAWVWIYPLGMIRLKWKPFNCEVCMSGWIACVYCWDKWYTPLWMAGAMVSSVLITKLLNYNYYKGK